ncbi:MAG: outer membrane protein transport protein [Kiritimatiellae bacterium]|jgi:long-chain fatty acid transport protein|nr:outer membrane protein transport protein [Kiritimatiellia bacterium]
MKLPKTVKLAGAIVVVLTLAANTVSAAGFAVMEQSSKSLGTATAGATASENADSVFFNPAGMTGIKSPTIEIGAAAVIPSFKFSDKGSTFGTKENPIPMPPLTGSEPDAGQTAIVPNLYYIQPLTDALTIGLSFNAPFGLETRYSDDWIGRYAGIKSDMTTMQLSPTIAWKISDNISIGAGVSVGRIDATLTSGIDFGGILASYGANTIPGMMDGSVSLEGDDIGYGFNIGAMYKFDENTRIGINYRSEVEYKLDGNAKFTVPPPAVAALAPLFTDTDISAKITTPDVASIGAYHKFNDLFALMADITWTGWSSFEELRVVYDNPAQPDSVTVEKWDDVFRYALGGEFYVSDEWTLRVGGAYDESPIPNEHRTVRIPGTDRIWGALGFSYMPTEKWSIDFAYMHIFFVDDPELKEQTPTAYICGDYDGTADVVSVSCSYTF